MKNKAQLVVQNNSDIRPASVVALELVKVQALIAKFKDMYDLSDKLTLELKEALEVEGLEEVLVMDSVSISEPLAIPTTAQYVKVTDNFATRNVVFKSAGLRRFEAVSETTADRAESEAKAMKKLVAESKKAMKMLEDLSNKIEEK